MDAAAHGNHEHQMPTSGGALTAVALSRDAALPDRLRHRRGRRHGDRHGARILERGTVALAVALAFVFGYTLTSLPLLRAGLALAAVVPIALASDTLDRRDGDRRQRDHGRHPGRAGGGLGDLLFWGSLAFALVIAGIVAVPVNRWLIARGKGHAVVHETGIHGGPSPRVVGAIAVVAGVFGAAVLLAELLS